MAASSAYFPRVSCSFLTPVWQTLQDQKIGLAQAPQTTASSCVPECVRFLCAPFKSEVSVSQPSDIPLTVSPTGLQSQMLLGPCLTSAGPKGLRAQHCAQTSH